MNCICTDHKPKGELRQRAHQGGDQSGIGALQSGNGLKRCRDQSKRGFERYDEHMPESSVEILGHCVGGITYRHYAHRAPLAFKAIMTRPQPTAFTALAKEFDGECLCCRRRFTSA